MFPGESLRHWAEALRAGEVAAAPAEGVYGYCCDPFNETALRTLMVLKQRDASKGLIVLVQSEAQLARVCSPLGDSEHEAIRAWWAPGQPPTTLILPAGEGLSRLLTGGRGTLAVRCPLVEYMREYLTAWGGPLVSTSLNIGGEAPATCAGQIPPNVVALTLAFPLSGTPSRIFDCAGKRWLR